MTPEERRARREEYRAAYYADAEAILARLAYQEQYVTSRPVTCEPCLNDWHDLCVRPCVCRHGSNA